jgi:hypothetical protein
MRGRLAAARGVLAAIVLLSGCASVEQRAGETTPEAQSPLRSATYEIVQGRDAAMVARMRASAPLAQPEIADGGTMVADEAIVRAQGLVRIGIGQYPATDPETLYAQVLEQAIKVGADKALVYPPTNDAPAQAVFFVRLQLPFGANFRDLTEAERATLGSGGVEIGEIVGLTPASDANLREGDFVLAFNKIPVRDRAQFQSLLQRNLGQRVTLTIRRDGRTMNRLIVLGTLPTAGH